MIVSDPWNLSYQKSLEAKPSWSKHGMPYLFEEFIKMVKDNGDDGGLHLDIGCGDGVKTVNFALAGLKTIGVDISNDGFKEARTLIKDLGIRKECKVIKTNALMLPFSKGVFTSASDILMFTHIKSRDWKKYKKQLLRVLKNRALVLLVLFSDKDKHFHGHQVSKEYTFRYESDNQEMEGFAHYHGMVNVHFGKADIKKTFKDDFQIVKMEEVQHPLYSHRFLWNVILRKNESKTN